MMLKMAAVECNCQEPDRHTPVGYFSAPSWPSISQKPGMGAPCCCNKTETTRIEVSCAVNVHLSTFTSPGLYLQGLG